MARDRGRRGRRKVCSFCVDKIEQVDYKEVGRLRRYVTERGKLKFCHGGSPVTVPSTKDKLPTRSSGPALWH